MSAIIGTPPAPPLQRIGQLEKLILAGEGGFACGGVIGKDVISPAELALYFSDTLSSAKCVSARLVVQSGQEPGVFKAAHVAYPTAR